MLEIEIEEAEVRNHFTKTVKAQQVGCGNQQVRNHLTEIDITTTAGVVTNYCLF